MNEREYRLKIAQDNFDRAEHSKMTEKEKKARAWKIRVLMILVFGSLTAIAFCI